MSFDFGEWRDWLAENVKEQPEGITAEFKFSEEHLSSLVFSVRNDKALAQFRSWENGLADYEIFVIATDQFVANEAMIKVDDANFATVFGEFVRRFMSVAL